MPPPGNGDGDHAKPQLEELPGDLLPGFNGDFLVVNPVEEEEEEILVQEEEETVEEAEGEEEEEDIVLQEEEEETVEEEEITDLVTPAGLVERIVDHLVIRDELWYFCHFSGQSVYSGRYLLSTVLQSRMDLRVKYWEEKAHAKAGLRNKRKLDGIVHERGKLVIKENRF